MVKLKLELKKLYLPTCDYIVGGDLQIGELILVIYFSWTNRLSGLILSEKLRNKSASETVKALRKFV